ncbi:hypothetical protein BDF20DRAFT_991604 [Mycotypha africana]|uniref:uncharacterized protein n=1 Tax=Mycotypha africana TaxID=64632 RepID=UPI002300C4DF|nr:uncharacterized protein BDF20DRAFT_991604 [Mycotypha africana]KAI8967982.1 hypothetical protein BDF20DRAFT_991604 [Mycotypha africana]
MKKLLSFALSTLLAAHLCIIQGVTAAACRGDLHVKTQEDMDQVRTCKTYGGSIIVDNTAITSLKMNTVELLEGDLIITNNSALQRLQIPSLQGINGQFKMVNNKLLNSLEVPQLYATRELEISIHPALNDLAFTSGLTQVEKLKIADTTITKVDGLKMSNCKELEISNNNYLKSLSLTNATAIGSMLISANSPAIRVDIDNLSTLHDATFRDVAELSMKNLKKVSGDMSFISNSFENLQLPQTSEIAGTLTLTDNLRLYNLSMPQLMHLGGALSVSTNEKLVNINAFPSLQQVDGTLDITGGFDEIQFPALLDVRGGLNIQTSSQSFDCDGMNKLRHGVIKGNVFVCKGAVAQPESSLKGFGGANRGTVKLESFSERVSPLQFGILSSSIILTYLISFSQLFWPSI